MGSVYWSRFAAFALGALTLNANPAWAQSDASIFAGQVLEAVNVGGAALTYEGIDYGPDSFETSRSKVGTITRKKYGDLYDLYDNSPYLKSRWGRTLSYSVPVPPGEDYALVLQFREVYHSSPGRRVVNISVEGQEVIKGFDILAENGNDKRTTIVRRIDGINPAISGDKSALEFTIKATRDTADLNAFVVLCTAGQAACGERAVLAQAARAEQAAIEDAKAKVEAEAERRSWIGRHGVTYTSRSRGGIISQVTGRYKTTIWVSDEGAIAHLRWQNVNCDAAFGPGDTPEEMPFLGHTYNSESQQWGPMTLVDQGRGKGLGLRGTRNGAAVKVNVKKEISGSFSQAVPPKEVPLDLAGVTLGATVGETQQKILAAFKPADAAMPFQEMKLKGGGYRYDFAGAAEGGEGKPEERFYIFSSSGGSDARAAALVRRWAPMASSRPTYESLMSAIEGKYGQSTAPYILGDKFTRQMDVGRVWAFDPSGFKRDKPCTGSVQRRFSVPAMRTLTTGLVNRTPPLAATMDCGWSIELLHDIRVDASPLKIMQFAIINHVASVADAWARESAAIPGQMASIQAMYKTQAAQVEERKAVKPKL